MILYTKSNEPIYIIEEEKTIFYDFEKARPVEVYIAIRTRYDDMDMLADEMPDLNLCCKHHDYFGKGKWIILPTWWRENMK